MSASSVSRRIRNILREVADKTVELDYPANHRERSIDFVVSLREHSRERPERASKVVEKNVVIRTSPGKPSVSSEVEEDLAEFSEAIDGVPLVVSNELYDNIVFDHGRVFLGNERTLENLLKERELIALFKRNELYVALNVKLIEREIDQGGLRLSELSSVLGLSRKSVENYLKGLGLISVDRAERLVAEYGPDTVRSIDYEVLRELFKRKRYQGREQAPEPGRPLVYQLRRTAVDFVIREALPEEARSLRFYVDFERTRSVRLVKAKVVNALRLARELEATVEVVAQDPAQLELLKREIGSELREVEPYIRFSSQSRLHAFQRSSA